MKKWQSKSETESINSEKLFEYVRIVLQLQCVKIALTDYMTNCEFSDMQSNLPSRRTLVSEANSIPRTLSRWLWGYDFFVSYHWQSGGRYAIRLAEQLRQRGFDVFLDQSEFISGDDWEQEAALALKSTQRLIVVATCEAVIQSEPVAKEIGRFSKRRHHIVPIVFINNDEPPEIYADNRELSVAARSNDLLADSLIFIKESVINLGQGPTSNTLEELSRAKGMMRRRTVRYGIVAATMFVLLLAAVISGMLGIFANAQKNVAERRFDNLQALTESTVTELHDIVQELPGALRHRELLVANSLPYLDNLLAEEPDDEATLRSLAIGYLRLGDVLGHPDSFSLGKSDDALLAWNKANAVTLQLIEVDPLDPDYQLLSGNLAIRYAMLDSGSGKHEKAVANLADAEQTLIQFAELTESSWEMHILRSQLLMRKGDIELDQGFSTKAQSDFNKACQTADGALKLDPDNRLIYAELASCQERIAGLKQVTGELVEARKIVDSAIDLRELLENEEPYNALNLSRLCNLYTIRGDIERNQLKHAESLASYQMAADARRRLFDGEPGNVSFTHSLATDLERLGSAFETIGDIGGSIDNYEESQKNLEESLELRTQLVSRDPGNSDYLYHQAIALERLADLLKNNFELTAEELRLDVEERYREALLIRRELVANSPDFLEYQKALPSSELTLGRYLYEYTVDLEEASKLLESASIRFQNLLATYPDVVQLHKGAIRAFSLYGQVLQSTSSDYKPALTSQKKSVEISESVVRRFPDRIDLLKTYLVALNNLSETLYRASADQVESLLLEAQHYFRKADAVISKIKSLEVEIAGLDMMENEVKLRLADIQSLLDESR